MKREIIIDGRWWETLRTTMEKHPKSEGPLILKIRENQEIINPSIKSLKRMRRINLNGRL